MTKRDLNECQTGLLNDIAQFDDCKYVKFRYLYNHWRKESYFKAQLTVLSSRGYIVITSSRGARTIEITDAGRKYIGK